MLQVGSARNPLSRPEREEAVHGLSSQGCTVPKPSQSPEDMDAGPPPFSTTGSISSLVFRCLSISKAPAHPRCRSWVGAGWA